MNKTDKIFVAGHNGLVGSAIVRKLQSEGYTNVVTISRKVVDLRIQADTFNFFRENKFDYVFLAAAKVGGIHANKTYPGDFICHNLYIQSNVIEASKYTGVFKLLFLGSSCIYPKMCPQPIKEEYLMTGPLEPTNSAYAIAKIAGIEMIKSYAVQYGFNGICLMPTNLYGPGDNFHPENSHVLPGLMHRFHEAVENDAPSVTAWGTGSPLREFLHVDDLADACVFLMENYNTSEPINVGSGEEVSIKTLTEIIVDTVGFKGKLEWDASKPDGTPRKFLDISKLNTLGWHPKISLADGLKGTYEWYLRNRDLIRV